MQKTKKTLRETKTEHTIPDEPVTVSDDDSNKSLGDGVSHGETNKKKKLVQLPEERESELDLRTR